MFTYTKERCFRENLGLVIDRQTISGAEPEHLHEFVEMVYIASGTGVHSIDGVEYGVRRGDLLFINYRQVHSFRPDGEIGFFNVLLDPEWISERLIDSENAFELLTLSAFSHFRQAVDPEVALVHFSGEEQRHIESVLCRAQREQTERPVGYETVLKAYATVLLSMVFRKMSKGSPFDGVQGLDPEFLSYIRNRCSEKLTLEDLAKKCFYNPSYFSRMFKEHVGMTVTEFINRSRLERVMELLQDSSLSVEEAAFRAGFRRKAGFYRLFRGETGMTPQEYRKSKKK